MSLNLHIFSTIGLTHLLYFLLMIPTLSVLSSFFPPADELSTYGTANTIWNIGTTFSLTTMLALMFLIHFV